MSIEDVVIPDNSIFKEEFEILLYLAEKDEDYDEIKSSLNITKENRQGKIIEITVKGEQEKIEELINSKNPIYFEALPLTLEELFISEMEVAGYDINSFKV